MKKLIIIVLGALLSSFASYADNSWGDPPYHWARTSTAVPFFDLQVINSTTSDWDSYVTAAIGDWSASSVLNMIEDEGNTSKKTRRRCKGGSG